MQSLSGRSSGVEHNLAKVGVGRSNRLARSSFFKDTDLLGAILINGCILRAVSSPAYCFAYLAFTKFYTSHDTVPKKGMNQ